MLSPPTSRTVHILPLVLFNGSGGYSTGIVQCPCLFQLSALLEQAALHQKRNLMQISTPNHLVWGSSLSPPRSPASKTILKMLFLKVLIGTVKCIRFFMCSKVTALVNGPVTLPLGCGSTTTYLVPRMIRRTRG